MFECFKKLNQPRWWYLVAVHIMVVLVVIFGLVTPSFALLKPIMTSSKTDIHTFLIKGKGSGKAKLVFVEFSLTHGTKNLCFIDFSEDVPIPLVRTIAAVKDAHVPVISPDGRWVVYAVGEGTEAGSPVSLRSSVYLCEIKENATPVLVAADSACEPRFMLNSEKLTVIYPTLAPNCAWEGYGKTMKVAIDVSGGTPVIGNPEILFDHGSYTGGLSWNGKFLCGGGRHIAMIDISSGKTRPDTVSLYSQSCNASISSSTFFFNTMMHLSLKGSHTSINGGKEWKSWQVLLLNNSEKQVIRGYWYPTQLKFGLQTNPESFIDGNARWHHGEWSNHPYFATATLNADRFFEINGSYQNTYYQERIYLINLKDSLYLEVLRPDTVYYSGKENDNSGFYWPWLWVDKANDFKEDTTWLTPHTAIHYYPKGKLPIHSHTTIQLINNRVSTSFPIKVITMYMPNGKVVDRIRPKGITHSLSLFSKLGISSGMRIIKIQTEMGYERCFYLPKLTKKY